MAAKADSKSSNPKTIWSTQSLVVPCSLLSLKILIFNKDRLSTVYPHSKLTVQISLVYAALPTGASDSLPLLSKQVKKHQLCNQMPFYRIMKQGLMFWTPLSVVI